MQMDSGICDKCSELRGKSCRQWPHDDLKEIDKKSHKTGMARGAIYKYRCNNCGTVMARDTDTNDEFVTWWVDK
jgi:hypothetical protein